MYINLQLSDAAYQRLISGNARLRGSIGLINPTEGNFNEYARTNPSAGTKWLKLRHGRATVGPSQVRLTLRIALDEADIVPAQAIEEESRQASAFVDDTFGSGWE